MTPEEARLQAQTATLAAGEEKVAVFIKSQFRNLGLLYDGLAVPDLNGATPEEQKKIDADFRRMAGELIDRRAFSAPAKDGGTITISLDDLDRQDTEKQLGIKELLRVDHIAKAVPTREQLQATANAVGGGVAENTGTIGFLGGATFMDALMGLFQWIAGLISGDTSFSMQSLTQTIAGVTASNMEKSVAGNLEALRQKDPSMASFLTDDAIVASAKTVGDTVRGKAGVETPAQTQATLATTAYATIGDNERQKIAMGIEKAVLHPEGKESLAETVAQKWADVTQANNKDRSIINPLKWFGAGVVSKEQAMPLGEKAAGIIALTIAATATNPAYRTTDGRKFSELNEKETARALGDEVGATLLAKEAELKLPIKLSEVDPATKKPYIEMVKDIIKPEIAPHFEQLNSIAKKLDPDIQTARASAKAVPATMPATSLAEGPPPPPRPELSNSRGL